MTVHASKGLEFRHVFVVGLEEELFPSSMAMGSQREIEEERRLLYVAITRAEETCTLSYAASRYRNGKPTATPPSRFLKDIDAQYLAPASAAASRRGDSEFRTPFNRSAAWRANNRFTTTTATTPSEPYRREQPASRPVSPTDTSKRLVRIDTAAPAASHTNATPGGLTVGTTIRHDRFGVGRVFEISGEGDNVKIGVEFDHVGTKHLLLKFAKFVII